MKNFKKLLFALFALPISIIAQSPLNGEPGWGIGVILPQPCNAQNAYGFTFPRESITTYNQPNGKAVGKIASKMQNELSYMECIEYNNVVPFPEKAWQEVDYEQSAVVVYAVNGEWLAVQTTSDPVSYRWIKTTDLELQGYRYQLWKDFLLQRTHSFYPMPDNGLNLRDGAGTEFNVVTKLTNGDHLLHFTGKSKGAWMEVKAELWPLHPCEGGEKASKTYTGWIKALDDKGFPNVWFDTRGC